MPERETGTEVPPTVPADSPLSEAEATRLKRLARLGVIALAARTVVQQILVFGSTIAFARLLDPRDFGVYATSRFALSFFTFFGDVGVGGALIRQKHEPTQRELSSVFFFQLGLALVLFTLVMLLAGEAPRIWSDMSPATPWVIRALALDLLLTALRIVPSILLERALQFRRLAVLDVLLQLSYLLCALPLAALGFGVWALAAGAICQGTVSLIGAYVLRPWRPSLAFDWPLLAPVVRFGLAYQARNVIGFINGAATPLYAGHMLGLRQVGFINWARDTAWAPLKLVEIIARVNYPLYARLHGDQRQFSDALARSVKVCGVVALAFVGFTLGLGPSVVRFVFSEKWLPALPYLYIFAATFPLAYLSPIVGTALDAAGQPGVMARLVMGWTVLNWTVVLLTTPRWGAMGYVAGLSVHIIAGNLAVVYLLRKLVPGVSFLPRMRAAVVAAIVVTALGRLVLSPWVTSAPRFVLAIVACLGTFASLLVLLDRTVIDEARVALKPSLHDS